MSNTKKATATAKPEPDEGAEAQQAQVAEANGHAREFEFDGHTYTLQPDQPSWIALDYLARWSTDNDNMALVPAIKEIIGEQQFYEAARRHKGEQLFDFFAAMNKAAGGN